MKAAIVQELGKPPVYGEFKEPTIVAGAVVIGVTAAALSQLTRGRASGMHYSTQGSVPFIAGVDGVGKLSDGQRVYFVLPKAPFGGMAERVAMRSEQCIPLPDDLDDVTAAAIANPGMSSWAALTERAKFKKGETVLVNGATGTSGRLAVQIARYMGAKRIVATGRNPTSLAELATLGADVTVHLGQDMDATEEAFKKQFAGGIDVVLDYLWGPSAERLLAAAAKAGKEGLPIRFVHIGGVSGAEIKLPGAVLRSSGLQLMGSGLGSVPFDKLLAAIGGVFAATVPGGFKIATHAVPLSEVEKAWTDDGDQSRLVFTV
jgi:NADPH:quinone reductase-like Zn-dependent oxidoreductase